MPLSPSQRRQAFNRIASPSGGLSMVAMDQRESLRTMFHDATGQPVPDSTLADFKLAVTQTLSPHTSAILLDLDYGREAMAAVAPGCGLVVAADTLRQEPGEIVQGTEVDTNLDRAELRRLNAAALKLLVIWRPDKDAADRVTLVETFLRLCADTGMLSIVEGVVRPPAIKSDDWNREAAILAAARELGGMHPDLYKAEVPLQGRGAPEDMQGHCQEITDVLPCPWVVLSSGVTADDFPGAVEAACRGGASGFLAGRGIWMDLVGDGDYRSRLESVAVPRLERLSAIVQASARPWWEGTPATSR